MNKANNSDFRFEKYIIKYSLIDIKGELTDNDSLNISITPKGIKYKDKFILTLDVKISDNKNIVTINIIVDGIFFFKENIPCEQIGQYFTVNAPAIIFPYIRGYISMLTSLSGMGNIVIPTLNLTDLGKELAENIEDKSE